MLLECRGITVGYAGSPVLENVDFAIGEGEIVTLVGANGAGKSTLVKTVSGLLAPMSGEMWFAGKRIDRLAPAERLALGIAHVPEGRQVFAGMTVSENLDLGGYVRRNEDAAGQQRRLREVFEQYPFLEERAHEAVGNFSGGQQQMLAIARGLMSGPRLIMLDEPSLGLSPLMVIEVFNLVTQLRARGHSILLSEQNARAALAIADRGYVIENGRVALTGKASELLASPAIAERYLGVGAATRFSAEEAERMAKRLAECIGHALPAKGRRISHEALEIIKAEHRSLAAVLDAGTYLIGEIRAGRMTSDFKLLWAIVSYIERFPEGLHHPREEDVFFKRLRERTHDVDGVLEELAAEHHRGHERVRTLQLGLGRYEGGAPDAFEDFASRFETFAKFNWQHMKREENEIFPAAEKHLLDEDWEAIATAFRDNQDPMLGGARADHFRELFRRIINLAPPPLGLGR